MFKITNYSLFHINFWILLSLLLHLGIFYFFIKPAYPLNQNLPTHRGYIDIDIIKTKASEENAILQPPEVVNNISNKTVVNKTYIQPQKPQNQISSSNISTNANNVKTKESIPVPNLSSDSSLHDHSALGIKVIYPRLSRILKEEGQVILLVNTITPEKTEQIKIIKSSGYPRLDTAAIEAFKNYVSLHTSQNWDLKISFSFKLKNL